MILDNDIELHNFYFPAGGDIPDPEINLKFKHKLAYVNETADWFKRNREPTDKIIILGDLNIAPLENDVWSHKQLLNVVSHTPIEVEHMEKFYKSLNFQDPVRRFFPEPQKIYTWWSYRNQDWQKSNRGRRLDHIWTTEPLITMVKKVDIFTEARNFPRPSDHVPISITL